VVVSVIEITKIALLVMVGRAKPLMARMIRHDAIVRKYWVGGRRSEVGSQKLAKSPDKSAEGTSCLFQVLQEAIERSFVDETEPVGEE
jgi:hypothetical protein